MNGIEEDGMYRVQKVYVKPLTVTTCEWQSVTTGGSCETSSTLEWFKERLSRVATMDAVTKVELEYAVKYYEVNRIIHNNTNNNNCYYVIII